MQAGFRQPPAAVAARASPHRRRDGLMIAYPDESVTPHALDGRTRTNAQAQKHTHEHAGYPHACVDRVKPGRLWGGGGRAHCRCKCRRSTRWEKWHHPAAPGLSIGHTPSCAQGATTCAPVTCHCSRTTRCVSAAARGDVRTAASTSRTTPSGTAATARCSRAAAAAAAGRDEPAPAAATTAAGWRRDAG